MPVIARFCGIVIRLLCLRPFGAFLFNVSAATEIIITLPTLEVIQGDAPPVVRRLVLAWARRHYLELLANTRLILRGQRPLTIAA